MMQPQAQTFQDGQTRVVNGIPYRREGGTWRRQSGAPSAPSAREFTIPANPVQVQRETLEQENIRGTMGARDVGLARDDRNEARAIEEQTFDRATALRKEFEGIEGTRDFLNVRNTFEAMQRLAENGNNSDTPGYSDIGLIFAYMKALDPTSVVREGEFATAQNAGGVDERLRNMYNQFMRGGRLQPNQRAEIIKVARELYQARAAGHNERGERYRSMLEEAGVPRDRLRAHIPIAPMYSGGEMGGYIDDAVQASTPEQVRRLMAQPPADVQPETGPLQYERPVTVSGPQDIQTGDVSHRLPAIDEKRLAALQGFAYGLARGAPEDALLEQLRANGIDPNTTGAGRGSVPWYLAERRRLGNREFRRQYRNIGVAPSSYTIAPPDISDVRGTDAPVSEGADAAVRGVSDTASLGFSDEISAGLSAATGNGTYDENVRRERAIADYDSENNSIPRIGGQVVGGFLLPAGGARTATGFAKLGGAYGAGYGLGSGDGGALERLQAAGTGGAVGAAAGYALGSVGDLIQRRFGSATPRANPDGSNPADIALAAERQGVNLPSPDALQGRRGLYGFLESLPGAGGRIRNDVGAANQAIEQRVATVGGASSSNRQEAGEVIRGAANRYIDQSRDAVGRLYTRAEQLSGGAQIQGTNALSAIDRNLAELAPTAAASPAKTALLQRLRSVLVDPATGDPVPLTIQSIRNLRTDMRDEIAAQGLRFSDADRRVMGVIDDLNTDIRAQLSGPALRAFDRADGAHRERVQTIDNVVQKFIGSRNRPNSSEQVMGAVESMSRPTGGNAEALRRMTSGLTPAERSEVAGHIARQLGRQDKEGVASFSPNRFFTQIQDYSREARQAIWGRRGAQDMADLATIAQARGGTTAGMNNTRSGVVQNWRDSLAGLVGLGAGYGVSGAAGSAVTAGALGGGYLTARALGNPEVVRALAIAARGGPSTRQNVIQRLTGIATREPALAPDIQVITRALGGDLNAASRAAAESGEDGRERN